MKISFVSTIHVEKFENNGEQGLKVEDFTFGGSLDVSLTHMN